MISDNLIMKRLPIKLGKEPIVDAVFEVRLAEGQYPLSAIFPGFVSAKFGQELLSVSKLPIADIPAPIRDAQEEMRYQPILSMDKGIVSINVSDHSVMVGCKLPYPGWQIFRSEIINVMSCLSELYPQRIVKRYSIKYVDFINTELTDNSLSSLNVTMSIANKDITRETCHIRTEFICDGYLKLVGLATNAKLSDVSRSHETGLVVDIDIICNEGSLRLKELDSNLSLRIDKLHEVGKKTFFECLSEETLQGLEPNYG